MSTTSSGSAGSQDIGIIVVNYACSELIGANLAPVRPRNARVVVVDNFSSAEERVAVRSLTEAQGWTLVEMADNAGFGPGVNAGVQAAERLGCACLLLLNPDAEVTADLVEELRTSSLADPDALISPCLVDTDGRVVFAGSRLDLRDGRISGLRRTPPTSRSSRTVTWLTAACLALSLDLWQRAGGMDDGYFMYWEDVDFNLRCRAVGGRPTLREDLAAVHDQGGTQGPRRGRAKSALYYFYNCRNRLLFGARHLRRGDLLRWMLLTPRVSWEVYLHGGRRQLLESPLRFGSVLAGAGSGLLVAARAVLPRWRVGGRRTAEQLSR